MLEWRSGSAVALQANGRGFKSLLEHHLKPSGGHPTAFFILMSLLSVPTFTK